MNNLFCATCLLGSLVIQGEAPSAFAASAPGTDSQTDLRYPKARHGDQVDDYHGTKVADPYRWLEDPDSAETRAWVKAQNELTFGYLEQIPERAAIRQRLTQLWNYERFGLPVKYGNRYFYMYNDGLQNQAVLDVAESLDASPKTLIDSNTLLADGTAALVSWVPNKDGTLLAYGIAEAGSDWVRLKVRDVATGADRSDVIKWVKLSWPSWAKDGSGFYYARFDEPSSGKTYTEATQFHKLYFHRLGDPQSSDRPVYETSNPGELLEAKVTDDGRYLIVSLLKGAVRPEKILYRDLQGPDTAVVPLITGSGPRYDFVGNDGGRFWFRTDDGAPMGRMIEVDSARPSGRTGKRSYQKPETRFRASAWLARAFSHPISTMLPRRSKDLI